MARQIDFTQPTADEIEISVLGPGYGECIVAHLGDGEWLINDSCVETSDRRREPVALRYLRRLGVTVGQVKVVIASHWHDDHIRGLGEIVEACPHAVFACSAALQSRSFLNLIKIANGIPPNALGSGVTEFTRIMEVHKKTGFKQIRFAGADHAIWRNGFSTVHTLSPSAASVIAASKEIGQLIPEIRQFNLRVPDVDQNHLAVVAWVEYEEEKVLLGADLERHADDARGWRAIIESVARPVGLASVYKVAHHGSITAHDDEIWSELLTDQNISVVAPWVRGRKSLPTQADVRRIVSKSGHSYITAVGRPPTVRPPQRSRFVVQTVRSAAATIHLVDEPFGHVQLRKKPGEDWRVGLSKFAEQLN